MNNFLTVLGAVFLIVILLAFGPLLTIWALNTLFPVLAIPYTFWTWLAVVIMGMFFKTNITVKK